MPVPGYQEFMLPLLKIASDGQEHTVAEAMETLARQMSIPDADRDILLPSGTQTRFYNRVTWALTYLNKSAFEKPLSEPRQRRNIPSPPA